MSHRIRRLGTFLAVLAVALACKAAAQPVEPVLALAKKGKPALLDTLEELVSIETGSRDSASRWIRSSRAFAFSRA